MNGDEVGRLLGLMALADNRIPPEDDEGRAAMIMFWLSMVGDLAYADAQQAVQDHYRESRDWIMPADIQRRVKAIRRTRLAQSVIQAPPPELADDPRAYRKALAGNIRDAADGRALPAPAAPLAIAGGTAQGERGGGPPVTLRSALTELRKTLGPARRRNHIGDPQAAAAEQAREAAAERARRERNGEVA
jgi:hypothetical protein